MDSSMFKEKLTALYEVCALPVFIVNTKNVNIQDLLSDHAGAIVRVNGMPSKNVMIYQKDDPALGCIAGWTSDCD